MQVKLDLRLRQLYEALEQVRTDEFEEPKPRMGVVGDLHFYEINFSDGISDAAMANHLSLLVANIASLKDHLKAWCGANNQPFRGDDLINSNRDVAIIHDLWNRDKHADLKQSRSGLFPELRDIHRAMSISAQPEKGSSVAIRLNPRNGQVERLGHGKFELVIDAEVVGAAGNHFGSLESIAARAIKAWENLLLASGVVLPPSE